MKAGTLVRFDEKPSIDAGTYADIYRAAVASGV
jgi:hypothetical protein